MKAGKTFLKYITAGGLMICLVIVLVPFYTIISSPFKPYVEIAGHIFSLPYEFTAGDYSEAWGRLNLANSLKNTVIISVLSNFDRVVSSSTCGYWITGHQNRGIRLVFPMLIAFMSILFQTLMIPFAKTTSKMHLTNSLFGLNVCLQALTVSVSTFIISRVVRSIPIEIEESALIDGCSPLKMYWTIVFPLIKASVLTFATINTLWFWNNYLTTQLMLSKKTLRTIQISTQTLFSEASFAWDVVLTALALATLPLFIFFVIAQRQVLEGASAGAVKGQRKRTSRSCYKISTIFTNTTSQRGE